MTPKFFLPWSSWLSKREDFDDWGAGCARVTKELTTVAENCYFKICKKELPGDSPVRYAAVLRLWAAVAHHWNKPRKQPETLRELLDRLSGKLGDLGHVGDVLVDCVACDAILYGRSDEAVEWFVKQHRDTIIRQAKRPVSGGQGLAPRNIDEISLPYDFLTYATGLAPTGNSGDPREEGKEQPSFADWAEFIAANVLAPEKPKKHGGRDGTSGDSTTPERSSPETYQSEVIAAEIKSWVLGELRKRGRDTIDDWWREKGFRANAVQATRAPFAKYDGRVGFSAGYVTGIARNYAREQARAQNKHRPSRLINDSNIPDRPPARDQLVLSAECLAALHRWFTAALRLWSSCSERVRKDEEILKKALEILFQNGEDRSKQANYELLMRVSFIFKLKVENPELKNKDIVDLVKLANFAGLRYKHYSVSKDIQSVVTLLECFLEATLATSDPDLARCQPSESDDRSNYRDALMVAIVQAWL
jgi:hypothetical protein